MPSGVGDGWCRREDGRDVCRAVGDVADAEEREGVFFSNRGRHTGWRSVSWARKCVKKTEF